MVVRTGALHELWKHFQHMIINMYRNEIVLKVHPVTKFKNLSLLGSIRTKLELGAIKWQQYMHITATVSF